VVPDPAQADEPLAVANDSVDTVFDAAGFGGMVEVALWPKNWEDLVAASDRVIPKLPSSMQAQAKGVRDQVLKPGNIWTVLHIVAEKAGLSAFPESLPGLNEGRPIVISIGRPVSAFESVAAKLIQAEGMPFAGLHSRIVLPADDSHEAMEAVQGALTAKNYSITTNSPHERVLQNADALIRLQAAKLYLSVDVVTGNGLESAPPDVFDDSTPERSVDSLIRHSDPAVARILVRYGAMEKVSTLLGMTMVSRALGSAAAENRIPMFLEGYAEVLSIPALMDPRGRVNTDAMFEVTAGNEPSVRALLLLTEQGAKALAIGMKPGVAISLDKVNWAAIFKGSPVAPTLASLNADSALQLIQESGFAGWAYNLSGNSLGMWNLWAKGAGSKADESLKSTLAANPLYSEIFLRMSERSLEIEAFTPQGATAAAAFPTAATTALSKSEVCYRDAQSQLRSAFHAYVSMDPATAGAPLRKAIAASGESLACAEADPALEPRVKAVQATLQAITKAL